MKCFDPKINRTIKLESKEYFLNDKYYLKDFYAWDENIRGWLAEKETIALNPEHHFAIEVLRNDYAIKRVHPVIRTVTSELGRKFGTEKGTVKYFHSLFPGGIHQAFLIAGLPMQDSCC